MSETFTNLDLDSVEVARALRWEAKSNGGQINMTQIMKLMYILYGFMLVSKRCRITKEQPKAWPYGPAFPRVQKHVHLSDPITDREYKVLEKTQPELIQTMKTVYDNFGKYSAYQLSSWSHENGSPWSKAMIRSGGAWNEPLSDEDIYNYFFNYVKAG